MADGKRLLDGARAATERVARAAGNAATAAVGVRVARSLYARWSTLAPAERQRIAPLAEDAKERALELRGAADRGSAERELAAANESLAAAIVESAEADPEVSEVEVRRLRDDLRRELDRLAAAEVQASRGPAAATDARARRAG